MISSFLSFFFVTMVVFILSPLFRRGITSGSGRSGLSAKQVSAEPREREGTRGPTIQSRCEHCDRKQRVSTELQGYWHECRSCGVQFRVTALARACSSSQSLVERIWYCRRGDTTIGPVSLLQLKKKLSNGKLNGADLVRQKGKRRWKRLDSLPGIQLVSEEVRLRPGKTGQEGFSLLRHNVFQAFEWAACGIAPLMALAGPWIAITSADGFEFGIVAFAGTLFLFGTAFLSIGIGIPIGLVLTVFGVEITPIELNRRFEKYNDQEAAKAEGIAKWTARLGVMAGIAACAGVVLGLGWITYLAFQHSANAGMMVLIGLTLVGGLIASRILRIG